MTDAEIQTTAAAVLAATSSALNPSPDISGCPDTIARLAIPAVLRAYAEAEHRFGDSQPATCLPGGWLEPDAWCVCGASWGEDGCTERERLLAVAAEIERAGDG